MAPRSEKVTFAGANGVTLAARLERPAGQPRAYALFAHCFTCSKDVFAATRIAGGLAERGIAVLRFDFTGLGASEGDFANTNFSSNVADLLAAAEHLRRAHEAPKILIGHSLGGAAVLAAAGKVPEAEAVATIGAPADPAHVRHLLKDSIADIAANGEAEVAIAGRSFRIRKQFLDDIAAQNLQAAIGALRKALLIFHAPRDQTVGIENAGLIFQAARHPKSFVSLDDADHLLTRHEDAIYVADVLAAWATRYLSRAPAPALADDAAGDEGVVVTEAGAPGRLAQIITAGGHRLTADEPVAAGGTGTGPSPYDLLAAALGACTAMTMRLYADRKGWPLQKSIVRLHHGKIHAEDCANCETKEGHIDRIQREIELVGPLDEEQRQRIVEIANKCPVHRTLHSEVLVETSLKR
ncbi:MAG: OsmC family protein [Proteobacteria bacterium]|nr:OsmC family protein [Pseudomonadota bacterium]